MKQFPQKTLVIVGPTASGKSDLAIALARRYNGEIISADSRQVYRGMDIGTGKVVRDLIMFKQKKNIYLSQGILHHLLDIASPKRTYNVTHFLRDAKKALVDIHTRGKVAILCGGTGFWIQALIENSAFPAVKPNPQLRTKLAKLSTEKLFTLLQKKDPTRAKTIDAHNKIRLIRALEICETLGTVPPMSLNQKSKIKNQNFIILVLNSDKEILRKNIQTRLAKRLKQGMIAEVKRLRTNGISWKKLESFGLEYRFCAHFLQKKISHHDLEARLPNAIWHYAKRQITWLKRFEKMGAQIHWISDPKEAPSIIEKRV